MAVTEKIPENGSTKISGQKKEKKIGIFIKILILVLFLFLVIGGLVYYWWVSEIKYDNSLLTPVVKIVKKSELIKNLGEKEVNQLIASFTNPLLIPKGIDVPEFSAEQNRPSRDFLDSCTEEADKLINKGILNKGFFNEENVVRWNNAYAKTNNPKYLAFALKQFTEYEDVSLEEMIHFTDLLKVQRLAVSVGDSNLYIHALNKIILIIDKNKETKDPLISVEILLLANSLPTEKIISDATIALKPVLLKAFHHKNEMRKDDLFLTPEQSTKFSLNLIKLSWNFYINKNTIPDWLYQLAEKEACRLAYRLEPDGCLPGLNKDELRISRCQEIYQASIVFDRDDLRYIASNGYRMAHSYPSIKKDFNFKEIGIFILRTKWNNIHNVITYSRGKKPVEEEDCIQVTYDKFSNKVFLSVGTITQIVFDTTKQFKNLKELTNAFEFKSWIEKEQYQYKVIFNHVDFKIIGMSKPYFMDEKGNISSIEINFTSDYCKDMKNSFIIGINKNKDEEIKEMTFFTNRR